MTVVNDESRLLRVLHPSQDSYEAELARLGQRTVAVDAQTTQTVLDIIEAVRTEGDAAVRRYTERFDQRSPDATGSYEITAADWTARASRTDERSLSALRAAAARVREFHEKQVEPEYRLEDAGVCVELRVAALSRIGIYVPGGSARYPSSVLMTAIPARVAGVGEIIMVTPSASPEVLAAASIAEVDRVYEIGGAQAIAALAYGTDTIPRVDKIVGPGNQWVATAKRLVFGDVSIDSVAGPSEVVVVADEDANPKWVAADLLAQAEHDVEARPILVTTSDTLAAGVERELASQLATLPKRELSRESLSRHGVCVVASDLEHAVRFVNAYAPEHVELHLKSPRNTADQLVTSGAIFVGPYAPEAVGDYVAGPSHVLPTGGSARYASPLGVYDFRKRTSIIEYSAAALANHAKTITDIAEVEELAAHARSVRVRLEEDS